MINRNTAADINYLKASYSQEDLQQKSATTLTTKSPRTIHRSKTRKKQNKQPQQQQNKKENRSKETSHFSHCNLFEKNFSFVVI